jgi:hypothetical protein
MIRIDPVILAGVSVTQAWKACDLHARFTAAVDRVGLRVEPHDGTGNKTRKNLR